MPDGTLGAVLAEKSQQNMGKHGFCWIIFVGYRTSNLLIFQQISKVLRFQYFWLELSIYSNIGILVELFLLDIFFNLLISDNYKTPAIVDYQNLLTVNIITIGMRGLAIPFV